MPRTVPLVRQTETAECGIACVAMVSGYHGGPSNLGALRATTGSSQRGATLQQMILLAKECGLTARPVRLEPNEIGALRLPVILHWDLAHFVVLTQVRGGKLTINDPASGKRRISSAEFNEHFTGVALELTPAERFQRLGPGQSPGLMEIFGGIKGIRSLVVTLSILSIVIQAIGVIAPFYTQLVVDKAIVTSDLDIVWVLAAGFGLLMSLGVVVSGIRDWFVLSVSSQLSFDLAVKVFHHLIGLPSQYFERRHIGDIASRFSSTQQLQQLVTSTTPQGLVDGVMSMSLLGVMAVYDLRLSLLVLFFGATNAVIQVGFVRYMRIGTTNVLAFAAKENTHFLESLRGIQRIRASANEAARESEWQNKLADRVSSGLGIARLSTVQGIVLQGVTVAEAIVTLWAGSLSVMNQQLSLGMLLAFLSYKSQFLTRASTFVQSVIELSMAKVHMERLRDIIAEPLEIEYYPTNPSPFEGCEGRIEIDGLGFRYSKADPWVLKQVSFVVGSGESVALVGPSGCGKSTLLKILCSLTRQSEGRIHVDGQELHRTSLDSYRRRVACVLSDDQLFGGTIMENITMFSASPDLDWAKECARIAQIDSDILRMPMTYNSHIGDMGSSLSAGQKQRIMIARALYSKPLILFMDEATCHLNRDLEACIDHEIRRLKITRVFATHRPESMKLADRIINLSSINRVSTLSPVANKAAPRTSDEDHAQVQF